MFTLLNILNYLSGRFINVYVVLVVTICIYFYILMYLSDTVYENNYLFVTLIILLLIDITTIIFIFGTYSNCEEPSKINLKNTLKNKINYDNNIKQSNEKKSSKKKSSKKRSSKKSNKLVNNETNLLQNKIFDIISVYDNDKVISIETY